MDSKVWIIADTHFGLKGDNKEWLDDYIGYFEEDVIPYMKKNVCKNDILIHCGDVFDNRSVLGLETISRVISLFEKFSDIFSDIRIIVGNHDMMKKNTRDITSVDILKHIPNVKIYYEPCVDEICGKKCLFNPWIENLEDEKKLLDGVDVDYVFGHLQIGGVKTSDRTGARMDIHNGVSKSDFKNAVVYAGHVHIKQDNKNIHYVGNPYHKDRGDRCNSKGITILDIVSGKTEFIENTTSPKFMDESIYEIMNSNIGEMRERWRNNRINLHIKSTDITKCNFDKFREYLSSYYRTMDLVSDDVSIEVNSGSEFEFNDAKTSNDYLYDYLEKQNLDDKFKEKIVEKIEEFKNRI